MENKAALIILDGWGIGDGSATDAIARASTPNYDRYIDEFSNSRLKTFGENVGLPDGQMGNSEVGHLNIGAGRIVYQDLVKINKAISDNTLRNNLVLKDSIKKAEDTGCNLHLMGLLSHGGVHSSHDHLNALIEIIEESSIDNIFIHAFTDGRDVAPKSAIKNIGELESFIAEKRTQLATVIGRYYAMDRDRRWDRVKKAYDLLLLGVGESTENMVKACDKLYSENITDEFFTPLKAVNVDGRILPNDVVLCFNFRTDRCREITQVLTQEDMPVHGMKTIPLHYATMTRYDAKFKGVEVLFEKDNLKNTLGEVVSNYNGTQLRIAETEKYPHVTFFFSGGQEEPFVGEMRKVIASPKVATYDLQPEMSAHEVANSCIKSIHTDSPDFICLNFANPDMVGHTGVESAIIKAVETIDHLLGRVVNELTSAGYSALIIADHGNADLMKLPDGSPHTAHTTNLVPCILIGNQRKLNDGTLADVAPSILQLLDLNQPIEMTGSSLLK